MINKNKYILDALFSVETTLQAALSEICKIRVIVLGDVSTLTAKPGKRVIIDGAAIMAASIEAVKKRNDAIKKKALSK